MRRKTPLRARKPIGEKTHGRRFFTSAQKRQIWDASDGTCAACGRSLSFDEAVADHVIAYPTGKTEVSNGQILCARDNKLKLRMDDAEFKALFR